MSLAPWLERLHRAGYVRSISSSNSRLAFAKMPPGFMRCNSLNLSSLSSPAFKRDLELRTASLCEPIWGTKREGTELSAVDTAKAFSKFYTELPFCNGRDVVLTWVACHGSVDESRLLEVATRETASGAIRADKLLQCCQPPYNELFQLILGLPNFMALLTSIRADVLRLQKAEDQRDSKLRPKLRALANCLRGLLQQYCMPGALDMERVTWLSKASVVEKVAKYEGVHPVSDLADIKRRLSAENRRCYGLFSKHMVDEPLAFVHVALTDSIHRSIEPILAGRDELTRTPSHAIFYTITSPHRGLGQIDLGNQLIKRAVKELSSESVRTFATLSPLPGFRSWFQKHYSSPKGLCWLQTLVLSEEGGVDTWNGALLHLNQSQKVATDIHSIISKLTLGGQSRALESPDIVEKVVRPVLMSAAREYLLVAKGADGMAPDPVANFHLRNGASLLAINFGANLSARGLEESFGIMASYIYVPGTLTQNNKRYLTEGGCVAIASCGQALGSPPSAAYVHSSIAQALNRSEVTGNTFTVQAGPNPLVPPEIPFKSSLICRNPEPAPAHI